MRRKYVVYMLNFKDVIEDVSFFTHLDCKTSYDNVMLEHVVECDSYDDAEVFIRRQGVGGIEYTILEVFKKD